MLHFNLVDPLGRDLEALQFFKSFSSRLEGLKFKSQCRQREVNVDYVDAGRLSLSEVVHQETGRVEHRLVVELSLNDRPIALL